MIFAKLSAPFPVDAIHWRAQTVAKRGDDFSALALAFIDARDVQDRLDSVLGPENWSDSYTETPKGRLLCTLSIRVNGEWLSKSDGAGDTDVEGDKGAISDALKRAAVKWGIGRYLYSLGNTWAPCEVYEKNGKTYWKKWLPSAEVKFKQALAQFTPPPSGPITDVTRDWLSAQIDSVGVPVGDFCEAMGVPSLKAITYEQIDAAKGWLRDNRKAA